MAVETKRPKLTIGPIPEAHDLFPLSRVASIAAELIANVEKVIVGKYDQVALAVATLLADGHLLVEDVPGVAKTMLARSLAVSAGCSFQRIQCTPDLQPTDVLGGPYLEPQSGRTEFRFGPLFSQLVLVDEINRASPRTQAAMLEAMGEGMITWEKVTYRLGRPFMVVATQNPIEQEGTFPLPEAQKDRFLVQMNLGYPGLDDERQMLDRFERRHPIDTLKPVTTPDRIVSCQEAVRTVSVPAGVREAILAVVRATREHPALRLGASPRGSLGLFRLAQAMAVVQGKDSVSIDLMKSLAEVVLTHRLLVKRERKNRYHDGSEVIREIIAGKKPD